MIFIRRILLPKTPSTSKTINFRLDFLQHRRFTASAEQQNVEKFKKVQTTGFMFSDADGVECAKYAIYWGKNDPRNVIRTLPAGSGQVAAKLRAILEVIHVAREEETPPSLLIYSDLPDADKFLSDLSDYAKRDFYTRNDAARIKNADIYKDLFTAIQGLHLKIAHQSTSSENSENLVTEAIISDVKQQAHEKSKSWVTEDGFRVVENVLEPLARLDVDVGTTIDKDGKVVWEPFDWPKVYVAQRTVMKDDFVSSGYCTHWPEGQCAGQSLRFAPYPITEFRAELAAIEEALKQAENAELPGVTIVTSSAHFMVAWKCHWKRLNGQGMLASRSEYTGPSKHPQKEFFASKSFYDRILALVRRIKNVQFRYERFNSDTELGKELEKRCRQGLSYALMGKEVSEYKLGVNELTKHKDYRQMNIPLIRIFKTGTSMNAGYTWHSTPDTEAPDTAINCCGTPSVLLTILETAITQKHREITIRADSEKLIKNCEALLEVWKRNGWRNSQSKEIGKQKEWERVWKLKQKVRVNWEFMDVVDEEDRKDNKHIPVFEMSKRWPKNYNKWKKMKKSAK